MPRKENTKARTWERDRRERMNAYFKTLGDLLPPHQDGRKRNKVDILIHASKYIKDLHGRTEELFHAHASEVHKEELLRLKKLVAQLFSRTQLLSTLLKEAGISIPAEPAIEKVSAFKWSNKINVEDSEKLFSKVEEIKRAKKKKEKIVRHKVPSKRKTSLTFAQSQTKKISTNDNNAARKNVNDKDDDDDDDDEDVEDQENRLNCVNGENKDANDFTEADGAPRGSKTTASTTGSSSSTDIRTTVSSNRDASSGVVVDKLDSHKKVKRKSKTNEKNKIVNRRGVVRQPAVANITSGTLILSSGKIMPVVTPITPLTSNIIVNGQSQAANPILLSNGQSNQMIVMQHLPNPVQNSMIPVCNQTLINAVQKVTLNPVQNIQTNIVVSSQDWVSNVKSIINATKITGRKCILPKGREITKTTMTYKVPIPAVHKEKLEKPKEAAAAAAVNQRKDSEVKSKPKNGVKGAKNQQTNAKRAADETLTTNTRNCNSLGNNNNNNNNNKEATGTVSTKRILNTEHCTNDDEPDNKKSKSVEDSVEPDKGGNFRENNDTISACKSIESLRNVVQNIGTDVGDMAVKNNGSNFGVENDKLPATNNEKPNSPGSQNHAIVSSLEETDSSKVRNDLRADDSGESMRRSNSEKEEIATTKSDLEEREISNEGELSNLNDAIARTAFSEGINVATDAPVVENEKAEISLTKTASPFISTSLTTVGENGETNEARKEEAVAISESVKAVCNLGTRFDSLLQANVKRPIMVENVATLETSKIILNLDTNTTTTVKPETNAASKPMNSNLLNEDDNLRGNKLGNFAKDEGLKSLSYSANNSFIPISRAEALHSDLSNDIFASLQVPSSSHHPESISPTAAFLMAFPLVSSLNGKTEVLEEEMKEDFKYRSQTPPMLLQIGAIEPNSFKLKSNASAMLTKDNLITAPQNETSEMDKKNNLTQQHVATQQTTGVPKYVKSATTSTIECNKELENSSKLSNDQSEIKNNQNLIASNNEIHHKTNSHTIEVSVAKPMPKIVHTENLKEQYKIVQTSIPSSLTTAIEMNNTFSFTPATPTVSYSTTGAITSCAATQIQSTIAVHHNRPAAKISSSAVESSVASLSSSYQVSTESHHSIPASVSKYDFPSRSQYASSAQNFMPNYPNISENIELPHYTPPTFTSSTIQKTSVQNSLSNNNNNNVSNIPRLTSVVSQTSTQCHSVSKNPSSSQNLQQNYAVQSKDSHAGLNGNQNSKQQSQDHRQENYHAKKVETENFGQNFTFGKENNGVMNSQNQSVVQGNPNISMFQEKSTTVQSYMPYSKDSKKIIGSMSSAASTGKPILDNTVHYPQNPMIVASNYEQHSTVTENHNVKSTTTVAHNSSNFSILSWTTFSPVGGNNNNPMNYEQGQGVQVATDTAENKTICENFGYVPLHKDNVGYSNMLPEFPNETGLNVNKLSNNKPMLEAQKQPFIDQSKSQNIQTTIAPQKQNQNSSVDYKFNNDNKAKAKYSIENNFMQTNYPNMEHQTKHQTIPTKQDKTNYPMPSYNPQVLFNMPESAPQLKYSTENYTGANFKYTEKPQQNQKYQPPTQSHVPPALEQTNSVYKQSNQNVNKSKVQQIRAPVNWMMTPEIKHNTNISDIILPPIGKELEYCQNNLFTQNTSYNQGATNQFYNNYDATHSFPNVPVLQNEPKKVDTFYSEEQPFSWSPTKNTHIVEQSQSIKPIDQHIVPSTLPTLVGDLALGTNIPEKQNFLFGQMATTSSSSSNRLPSEHNKDLIKEKETNAGREYHAILNPQNGQHAAQGTFLSVSQLVEHEKAEKSQQARKHQRKSTSPRGSGKRQLEIRKQAASDQLHHDDPKSSVQTFPEQNYQQKYQQNEAHWRNRNCKSNYTAEALIGTNTNVQEDNQQDKHASIKFTPNYGQNKFPGTLATDTMMPGINYFPNSDDGGNYGQTANQNFNSYTYSSNANIYPTTNFITSISNTPSSYMMPLHESSDYLETNTFLLPNASSSSNAIKTHQHYAGKHQNCDKRSYSTAKRSKRKPEMAQNIEFPISGINSPLEDYHSSFLSHANLYQNPPQANIYPKTVNTNLPGLPMTGNQNTIGSSTGLPMNSNIPRGTSSNSPMVMAHPSGTSLTNFNLSTIFPEINDKVAGYKPPNSMLPGLTQPTGHGSNYSTQRTNYSNPLGHVPQVPEPAQFTNNMPPSSSVHYKNS